MKTIDGIKSSFQLKGDNAEIPDMYLGATIKNAETTDGTTCWTMSSEKNVKAAVENVKLKLSKSEHRLPSRCDTPMRTSYYPIKDVSKKINAQGVQTYQELIGLLRWEVKIGRVDILLEVSFLSSHLALPRVGQL